MQLPALGANPVTDVIVYCVLIICIELVIILVRLTYQAAKGTGPFRDKDEPQDDDGDDPKTDD